MYRSHNPDTAAVQCGKRLRVIVGSLTENGQCQPHEIDVLCTTIIPFHVLFHCSIQLFHSIFQSSDQRHSFCSALWDMAPFMRHQLNFCSLHF